MANAFYETKKQAQLALQHRLVQIMREIAEDGRLSPTVAEELKAIGIYAQVLGFDWVRMEEEDAI